MQRKKQLIIILSKSESLCVKSCGDTLSGANVAADCCVELGLVGVAAIW